MKVGELAKRYGMKPSEADANIHLQQDYQDVDRKVCKFKLTFTGISDKRKNFDRMAADLNIDKDGLVKANTFGELEDIVDEALARAPRARAR